MLMEITILTIITMMTMMTMLFPQDIEKRPVISPTLSEQLKANMRLLQSRFTVQFVCLLVWLRNFPATC